MFWTIVILILIILAAMVITGAGLAVVGLAIKYAGIPIALYICYWATGKIMSHEGVAAWSYAIWYLVALYVAMAWAGLVGKS